MQFRGESHDWKSSITYYLTDMQNEMTDKIRTTLQRGLTQPNRRSIDLDGYLKAGVLVPIVEHDNRFDLLFTRRTETVETHKGQVSFPGGVMEKGDADIVATALREAGEEIGLSAHLVRIIGLMDDVPTPTQFIITPVVGLVKHLPPLEVNSEEVAELFSVPLLFFTDDAHLRTDRRTYAGKSHDIYYYDYERHTIWGITALIVRSLIGSLRLTER